MNYYKFSTDWSQVISKLGGIVLLDEYSGKYCFAVKQGGGEADEIYFCTTDGGLQAKVGRVFPLKAIDSLPKMVPSENWLMSGNISLLTPDLER